MLEPRIQCLPPVRCKALAVQKPLRLTISCIASQNLTSPHQCSFQKKKTICTPNTITAVITLPTLYLYYNNI